MLSRKKRFLIYFTKLIILDKEGFGIGLALSKQIADTLGARIVVKDNQPQGSKFLLIFPNS